MKESANIKFILLVLALALGTHIQAQTDQDAPSEMQDQLNELQQQMEQMMKGFGDMGGVENFFFSDTLLFNDLENIPLDSMMQSFSFAFPDMQSDSMLMRGFDLNGGMFGNGFQDQLNQMFESLDDFGPEYFMDLEELKRQLEQNGIRPDDLESTPKKSGQKKKKIYKI